MAVKPFSKLDMIIHYDPLTVCADTGNERGSDPYSIAALGLAQYINLDPRPILQTKEVRASRK